VLQIPAQFPGFDGTDGRDEPPAPRAGHFTLPRRRRFIDEPGAGRRAAHAVFLVELQVGEFQDEFLQRPSGWLWRDGHFRREPLAHRDENRIHRRLDTTGGAAHGNVERFLVEQTFKDPEFRAVERKQEDPKLVPTALLLYVERVPQFLADPL